MHSVFAELQIKLLELSLSCSLGLLLALYRGLLIVLSLAYLLEDTGLGALSLESSQSTVQRLIVFYSDFRHLLIPSQRPRQEYLSSKDNDYIIQ